MNVVSVFEQSNANTMDWCVAPSFVEETSALIQVFEIVVVNLASPEFQVSYFEVAPKMACAVAPSHCVILRSLIGNKPRHSIVSVNLLRMSRGEVQSLFP